MTGDALELNEQQREAAEHVRGPLLVLAPVGTGKTTVIAHRAARAVEEGIDPGSVLCLSFTNRAAREMKERIALRLSRHAGEITVRTFHGLCAHILRHDADALGIASDFTICDEEDAKEVMLGLADAHGLSADSTDNLARFLLELAETAGRPPGLNGRMPDPRELFDRLQGPREVVVTAPPGFDPRRLLDDYNQALRSQNQVDFAGLIREVGRLFRERPDRLSEWQRTYGWVQVDEVQDTSFDEWFILRDLAKSHRNLAFFGDIDQTIYEWRDSRPFEILANFKRVFDPVREIYLTQNYRSARNVLRACVSFIRSLERSVTKEILPVAEDAGRKIYVREEQTLRNEALWVARQIEHVKREHGLRNHHIAILTRSNPTAAELSKVLTEQGVEHFVIDNLRFFRRPEVKDALAAVRVLINRSDGSSLLRLLKRLPEHVKPATLERVRAIPPEVGLRLTDFVDPATFLHGDPYAPLLAAVRDARLVVFDVEATGLDTNRDEVIELAAVRVGEAGEVSRLHRYLRNRVPVGSSALVHGITDEFLAREGADPAEAFGEFQRFASGCVLAGHNVGYDLGMVNGQLARLGGPRLDTNSWFDTLDMTRRFFRLPRYTLQQICKELGLDAKPSHHAMDDVEATWKLIQRLVPCVWQHEARRRELVGGLRDEFEGLHELFRDWAAMLERQRPIFLLQSILDETRLLQTYQAQPDGGKKAGHLRELVYLFERYDDATLPPREALVNLVNLTSLGNEADRYIEREDKVMLLTVHQAKGLEFDTVFIAGATDSQFPSYHSVREKRIDEEHRLFYVAMTRARKRVFISYHRVGRNERLQAPSRFIDLIPTDLRSVC
jgi:DNA helicase II / ATP-dependent DNA helicase PcrA